MTDKILIDRSVLQQALDAQEEVENNKRCPLCAGYFGIHKDHCELGQSLGALREALAAPQPAHCYKHDEPKHGCARCDKQAAAPAEPYGWAVTGCSKIRRGEFAEFDAKGEARRIGGTARAIALFEGPQPQTEIPLNPEQCTVFKYGWKSAEEAHITKGAA